MDKMKTAAELAMERTRHLASARKPGTEDYQEHINAARVLARLLLEKKSPPEKIKEAFDRYPEGAREQARRALFSEVAAEIDLNNTPQIIETIRLLSQDQSILEACGQVERLHAQYQKKLEESIRDVEKNAEKFWRRILQQEGIQGSALYRYTKAPQNEQVSSHLNAEFFNLLASFRSALTREQGT